ncbi:MAG TPA: PA2779 family protein [Candidatus Eisenbacteria bacterium]|nr:PA2779 family protein [Candidatus Eisenbacteria bacterium]
MLTLLSAALLCGGLAGTAWAGDARTDVVGAADIQAQIDKQVDREAADRQAIQDLLRRPDVRRIAGAAGLDIERATAAASVLSGSELKDIAARAQEVNAGVGGAKSVTLSVTAIIIIILLIILIAN